MPDPAQRTGIVGLAAVSALGRGAQAQLAGVLAGAAAFGPVRRFDVDRRRVKDAATRADAGSLAGELAEIIRDACADAGLTPAQRAETPLVLAVHGHPHAARMSTVELTADKPTAAGLAEELARDSGLAGAAKVYTCACVSGSTAVADAAATIGVGRASRIVVAAGYLVEPDQFALFDAGRALATDGAARPFSAGRGGLLLGDAVSAVVLEAVGTRDVLAEVVGWGRAGDAYHAVRPDPTGGGLARAITAALRRARVDAAEIGYVNANASGAEGDAAEAAALHRALGAAAARVPVSSTKSVHGHALEGSGLLELIVTVLATQAGKLPVNVGYLGADPACELDVILDAPRPAGSAYALSLNAAFGGANTALLVKAAS
ncbi:MAG: beta-ketoacyl-[acyl-carrier-protein] synthase family protein [Actinophytocola sp.]|uniref:beta-ketoacyl synthase N-terminal-like domain-containing protein n=1 Tax=Actinophytocola sp. TaxID=1872138 RepID=UPI001323D6CD|nr:beta-ketoacyl synthase N-terminal-like domain-containing protein [Actinophytocola sp.]MPZ85362.1 beta-ketoacyl-[acyl-carrier-protein] synthase family protein [Actinophytocola sp.]